MTEPERPPGEPPPDPSSDFGMAGTILKAVRLGWDPDRRDLLEGLTIAELRDIDVYERYWSQGEVTDELAHERMLNAHVEAVAYLDGLP
jgi:hypothetical protein